MPHILACQFLMFYVAKHHWEFRTLVMGISEEQEFALLLSKMSMDFLGLWSLVTWWNA